MADPDSGRADITAAAAIYCPLLQRQEVALVKQTQRPRVHNRCRPRTS